MKAKLIILGSGDSLGVPRIDGYNGNCDKKNKKNIRTRCSAIILKGSNYILIDTSPDIKNQLMLFHARENETKIPDADGDLGLFFQKVKRNEKHVSDILRHVMVRRTRRFLIKHWGKKDENGRDYLLENEEKVYFPKQILEIKKYDINKVYKNNTGISGLIL